MVMINILTDMHTHKKTDQSTAFVATGHIYAVHAMQPNNNSIGNIHHIHLRHHQSLHALAHL